MANPRFFNLARMRISTVGTGSLVFTTAVSGFLTLAEAGALDGDIIAYSVRDGAQSEVGYGTYTAATLTLTRNVRKSKSTSSSSTIGLISLSGSAQVVLTPSAEDFTDATLFDNEARELALLARAHAADAHTKLRKLDAVQIALIAQVFN